MEEKARKVYEENQQNGWMPQQCGRKILQGNSNWGGVVGSGLLEMRNSNKI